MLRKSKDDEARRESRRITRQIKRVMWLPISPAILCWGWFKRLFCRPASRGEEKDHQAKIRRELRGLPPEHDGGKHLSPGVQRR